MADILELSAQYRTTGTACREKLRRMQRALDTCTDLAQGIKLRRDITILTAMYRDCTATANYLRSYVERREQIESFRRQ